MHVHTLGAYVHKCARYSFCEQEDCPETMMMMTMTMTTPTTTDNGQFMIA